MNYTAKVVLTAPHFSLSLARIPRVTLLNSAHIFVGRSGDAATMTGELFGALKSKLRASALLWPSLVSNDSPNGQSMLPLPGDCDPESVVVVFNGQELWVDDYDIDPVGMTLLMRVDLDNSDKVWIRYSKQ